MNMLRRLYRRYIYGIIGTLIFHVLLFTFLFLTEVYKNKPHFDDPVLVQIETSDNLPPEPKEHKLTAEERVQAIMKQYAPNNPSMTADASNDSYHGPNASQKQSPETDFDREIKNAKALSAKVSKQLSLKIPDIGDVKMPAVTTRGQSKDSIRNVIYTGKSYNHYNLPGRYHVRFLIPTYLAQHGGRVTVSIQVNQMGRVVRATPQGSNPLLEAYAQKAALGTLFNTDSHAPSLQSGTITYTFIAQ